MTNDFLIGAIRASRDLHPQVKTELEEILHRAEPVEPIDRENVIKGLQIERECVSRDCDRDCGKCDLVQDRDWLLSVYDDAIALLKAQEPRVLTRDEMKEGVEDHRPVFVEEWTEGAEPRCFWGLIERGFDPPEHGYNYPGGVEFNVVDTLQDMWDGDFYGMNSTLGWRAWSTEPSEELRKAVPWT